MDRITDRPDMTSAVYRGRKASTQTNKQTNPRKVIRQDKKRLDQIYLESARHITINISSRALLNRLFENKGIK